MPNALANLFSWADGVKRRVSSPLQTIALGLQRGTEDLAAAGQDADVAYGRGGMNSVLVNPQQRAQAAQRSAEFGANMGLGAATVWHGSPHKFDKFDASKIGTGEGAQAYGHGLYLAESDKVAKQYRDALSANELRVKGGGVYDPTNPAHLAAEELLNAKKTSGIDKYQLAQNLREKEKVLRARNTEWSEKAADEVNATWQALFTKQLPELEEYSHGSLYKVDLPDNAIAKMLDWDKPLSQQAPEVQAAVKQVVPPFDANMANAITQKIEDASMLARTATDPATRKAAAQEHARLVNSLRTRQPEVEGKSLLSYLGSPAQASQKLRDAGIPGVRYLDGGSRGTGGGTSNYVVFPGQEDILKILERNGVPTK